MKRITLKYAEIEGSRFIQVDFIQVDTEFIEKSLQASWHEEYKIWYIQEANFHLRHVFSLCSKAGVFLDYKAILKKDKKKASDKKFHIKPDKQENNTLIKRFVEWMEQKRYSRSTQKTYAQALGLFLAYYKDKDVETLKGKDIDAFITNYVIKNKLSISYQNQVINACKLFFSKVLCRSVVVEKLERPKREFQLPHVLSKEEVKRILQSISNVKHRTILSLIYACGLRRSELIHLRITDINGDRKCLMVRQGKGKKDRMVPLSEKTLNMLREYYKTYKPSYWLFEGQTKGTTYSPTSIRSILKKACKKAGINKPVTPHWLRHSYATHLMENGTDTRYVQELLGHKSIKTTTIYTHVTEKSLENIRSPFDDL